MLNKIYRYIIVFLLTCYINAEDQYSLKRVTALQDDIRKAKSLSDM